MSIAELVSILEEKEDEVFGLGTIVKAKDDIYIDRDMVSVTIPNGTSGRIALVLEELPRSYHVAFDGFSEYGSLRVYADEISKSEAEVEGRISLRDLGVLLEEDQYLREIRLILEDGYSDVEVNELPPVRNKEGVINSYEAVGYATYEDVNKEELIKNKLIKYFEEQGSAWPEVEVSLQQEGENLVRVTFLIRAWFSGDK